jgi:hypothetical protein
MQKEELKSAILGDKHLFNDNLRSYLVRIIDLIEEKRQVVELPPVPEPVDQPVRSKRSQRVPLPSTTEPAPVVSDETV